MVEIGVNFIEVNFIGVTTKSCQGDTIFGIPSGWCWLIGGQFWMVIKAERCIRWKPHTLEGCQSLNYFFTRLEVTTEFRRGDTNVSGVPPGAPRCTPAGAMMKGVPLSRKN